MPALQRAGRRLRPGLAGHPGGARRRRVGGERPEDLDLAGAALASSASSSPAPTPTRRSTRGSPTSSARWTRPGIEIRPIVEMTGSHMFNEVFFDRRAPPGREPRRRREPRLGAGQGHAGQRAGVAVLRRRALGAWARRRATCSTSSGPAGGSADPLLRQRLAALHIEDELLRLIRLRTVTARIKGEQPGPEASVRKILADEHGQHDHGPGQGPGRRQRHARRPRAPRATRRCGTTASCSARRSPSAAAPARCSATSSPSGCWACRTTSTSRQGQTWAESPLTLGDSAELGRVSPPTYSGRRVRASCAMASRRRTTTSARHEKVVATDRPAGHPRRDAGQGAAGRRPSTWIRYRVLFANGDDRGSLDRRHLVRPQGVRARSDERVEVEESTSTPTGRPSRRQSATPPADDNEFGVPEHLLERAEGARAAWARPRAYDQAPRGTRVKLAMSAAATPAGSSVGATRSSRSRRPASTWSGSPRPTASTASASWATSPPAPSTSRSARDPADLHPHADAARHDRSRARRPVRRPLVLGLGASGPAGHRGLPWRALRQAARPHPRDHRDLPRGLAPRAVTHDGPIYQLPLPEGQGTGLGKPLKIITHPVRERDPDLRRLAGPEERGDDRRGRRRLAAGVLLPEQAKDVWGADLAAGAAKRDADLGPLDVVAGGLAVGRRRGRGRPRLRAGRWPPSTSAAWAPRVGTSTTISSALRLRGGGRGDPGPLPRRQEGGGRRRSPPSCSRRTCAGPRASSRSAWLPSRRAGVTVLNVTPVGEDPVKLVEQVQTWIADL